MARRADGSPSVVDEGRLKTFLRKNGTRGTKVTHGTDSVCVYPVSSDGVRSDAPSLAEMTRIRWGTTRNGRCSGLVLGVLSDPTHADPIAAIFAKRFHNLRRYLRHSDERITTFTRQHALFKSHQGSLSGSEGEEQSQGRKSPHSSSPQYLWTYGRH